MTLNELYEKALSRAGIGRNDPGAFDLSCLMEDVCGVSRFQLPLRGGNPAPEDQAARFFALLDQWLRGEPLQYLLGKWEFYGLPFVVGPGVLIPRQDTETLAEEALRFLAGREKPLAADLCSGSGCLACTMACRCPGAEVFALELSGEALPYLKRNVAALTPSVTVFQADVFAPPPLPPLDLIVSNPPYISRREMETLDKTVRREPEMALYGGETGDDFYRRIPPLYAAKLKPGGALMFEVGYQQAGHVAALLETAGYVRVRTVRDAAGIERVVIGFAP